VRGALKRGDGREGRERGGWGVRGEGKGSGERKRGIGEQGSGDGGRGEGRGGQRWEKGGSGKWGGGGGERWGCREVERGREGGEIFPLCSSLRTSDIRSN